MSGAKSIVVYFLGEGWQDLSRLSEEIATQKFRSCGQTEVEFAGFVPLPCPESEAEDQYVRYVANRGQLAMKVETRVLPKSAVQEEVQKRCEEIEKAQGFKPGRKQRKEVTENVTLEFLPRAFTKTTVMNAWFDVAEGLLVVEASSRNKAEQLISLLVKCCPDRQVFLPTTNKDASLAMTQWVVEGEAPDPFTLDDQLVLENKADEIKRITYKGCDLSGQEISAQIDSGMGVVALRLSFDDSVSFILTCGFCLQRCELLDVFNSSKMDGKETINGDQADATFALISGEYIKVIRNLVFALDGRKERQ